MAPSTEKKGKSGNKDVKVKKGSKASDVKVKKASKASKDMKKASSFKQAKVRRNVHFFRKATQYKMRTTKRLEHSNRHVKTDFPKLTKHDAYHTVLHPLATESAMKKIEEENTLVFLADPKATKMQIKEAVKKLYGISASGINTLIRPDGKKKAYIRVSTDCDALDIANKMGLI